MFKIMLKDLKLSPLKTFITGFAMLIGIVSVVVGSLISTLGKQSLISLKAQVNGFDTTYLINLKNYSLKDESKTKLFLNRINEIDGFTYDLNVFEGNNYYVNVLDSLDDLNDYSKYQQVLMARIFFTNSNKLNVFNTPISSGRNFNDSSMEVLVNKAFKETYNQDYLCLSKNNTLNQTPFRIVGVINDGEGDPNIFVNALQIYELLPEIVSFDYLTLYYHGDLNIPQIQSILEGAQFDSIGGAIDYIVVNDRFVGLDSMFKILEFGMYAIGALLLFVSMLGQLNIGLASLEQRSHELLIRRALGASKTSNAILVISSSILLSLIVSLIAIILSIIAISSIKLFLPSDSVIILPTFPINTAIITIIVSVFTTLLSALIPAIKASKLEPALALR